MVRERNYQQKELFSMALNKIVKETQAASTTSTTPKEKESVNEKQFFSSPLESVKRSPKAIPARTRVRVRKRTVFHLQTLFP
jgi:hypothetical protein